MQTIRVRFLTSVAGANFAFRVGKVYTVAEALARPYIDARIAVVVEEELAVAGAPEVAARRVKSRRG